MNSAYFPNSITGSFETDFKAEVIAAELVENHISAERIMILMVGALQRAYRKDVGSITEETSDYDHKEYLLIKTHKEGIYDMLPEGLFHDAGSNKSTRTEREGIDDIKQRRAEERNARRFFLPFEAAINHLRMDMALYENRLDKTSYYDDALKIFSNYWGIFEHLDTRQSNIFLHLLPIIHEIRDEHDIIEEVMQMLFLVPVHVKLRSQPSKKPADLIISRTSENLLGDDLTTGNVLFNSGEDEILISFGPLKNEEQQQFMPGTKNSRILDFLCDYLLPVHIDVVTEFELDDADKATRLADGKDNYNSTLDRNTYL